MMLYHGSNVIVAHPDVKHSKGHLDFGRGFYTTSVKEQAERWARRKAVLKGNGKGYVSVYTVRIVQGLSVLDFNDDLHSWIDFICSCRDGSDIYLQYDIIKGRVADDKVFRVVDMYKRGIWDRERAIKEIRVYESYDQIAFISLRSIDAVLVFCGSYEVGL